MKHKLTSYSLLALMAASPLSAAVWTGAVNNSWNEQQNWTPSGVPDLSAGETAIISNGNTVEYPSNELGDLIINNNGLLNILNSAWIQSGSTHWTQVHNGSITLTSSTFTRTAAGNVVLSMTSNTNAVLALVGGAELNIGGELWLGHNTNKNNHTAAINISGSTIIANGTVGLWVWDALDPGNNFYINFIGSENSRIEVSDRIGIRLATGETSDNQATWEQLWDLGILTAEGKSGLTGDVFSDYFITEGTNVADGQPYVLIYSPVAVPEPGVMGALALSVAGLAFRRRRA